MTTERAVTPMEEVNVVDVTTAAAAAITAETRMARAAAAADDDDDRCSCRCPRRRQTRRRVALNDVNIVVAALSNREVRWLVLLLTVAPSMPVLVMMCVVSVEVEISSSGGGRWIGNVHPYLSANRYFLVSVWCLMSVGSCRL